MRVGQSENFLIGETNTSAGNATVKRVSTEDIIDNKGTHMTILSGCFMYSTTMFRRPSISPSQML